jgi:hypothetical protein
MATSSTPGRFGNKVIARLGSKEKAAGCESKQSNLTHSHFYNNLMAEQVGFSSTIKMRYLAVP